MNTSKTIENFNVPVIMESMTASVKTRIDLSDYIINKIIKIKKGRKDVKDI